MKTGQGRGRRGLLLSIVYRTSLHMVWCVDGGWQAGGWVGGRAGWWAGCICPCLSLSVSVCLCLPVSVRVCPCLSVSVRVYPCLSVSVRVCPCLFVSIRVCLCVFDSVCVLTVRIGVRHMRWEPDITAQPLMLEIAASHIPDSSCNINDRHYRRQREQRSLVTLFHKTESLNMKRVHTAAVHEHLILNASLL